MDRLYEGCKVKVDPSYATVFQLPLEAEGCIMTRSPIVSDRWVVQFAERTVHLQDNRLIALSPARKEPSITINDLITAIPAIGPALSIPDPE